jgi:hypothetical protein
MGEILRPEKRPLFSPGSFITSPVEETRTVRSKLLDPTLGLLPAAYAIFFLSGRAEVRPQISANLSRMNFRSKKNLGLMKRGGNLAGERQRKPGWAELRRDNQPLFR